LPTGFSGLQRKATMKKTPDKMTDKEMLKAIKKAAREYEVKDNRRRK
jgi:hypothetical protein